MDEILAGINSSITDIELVSDDTRKAINDTFTSGVQEIEFYKFSMEVNFFFPSRRQSGITFFPFHTGLQNSYVRLPNNLSAFMK